MKALPLIISLTSLVFGISSAQANQFESVIQAMAIKTTQSHTNNGWEDTAKIKNVKWQWPYYESGAHDSQMIGTTKVGKSTNPNIGKTTITVEGARTMLSTIEIAVENEAIDLKAFGKGKVTRIKTSCDDDSATNTVEFFKFVRPQTKPLYLSHEGSWGAGGAGSDTWKVSYDLNDALALYPNACKAL